MSKLIVLAILIVAIIGFSIWNFNLKIDKEINNILKRNKKAENGMVSEKEISSLPDIVQKWLENSGVIGKKKIQSVYLKQKGLMRLKSEQDNWSKAEAEQYITINSPAYLWKVNLSMMPFLNVLGRDYFINGKGQMQMKIASLISVVNVDSNEKINQASLQRYLAELIWYPSAAISPYISWESIDQYSARATMTYKEVRGSVNFHFDKNGDVKKVWALRYKDSDKKAELKEWIGEIIDYSVVDDIKTPTNIEISWLLSEEKFTWYKFKVTDIYYNNIEKNLKRK